MSSSSYSREWTRLSGPLFAEKSGSTSSHHRILLHGFTQTSRSWDQYLELLDPQQLVTRVDAPGHAGSTESSLDLPSAAQALADQCGFGDYVGYSMGARLCLHIACHRPDAVRRLVLISGSPGLRTQVERDERIESDERLAQQVMQEGVESFVTTWLANPMFAGLPKTKTDLLDRMRNTPTGLAASLRMNGTGKQESLWDQLRELSMPVLLVVGENDEKFYRIGQEMKQLIGANAELVAVKDAGHSVHLEQPQVFQRVVENFLS
jgi:2-succinyl-6-hydroxy-2,4-cyclohexadiene-1-carboxylate synthase